MVKKLVEKVRLLPGQIENLTQKLVGKQQGFHKAQLLTVKAKVLDVALEEVEGGLSKSGNKVPVYIKMADGTKEVVYAKKGAGKKLASLIGNVVAMRAKTLNWGGLYVVGVMSSARA